MPHLQEGYTQFTLRIEEELRDKVKQIAVVDKRSLNKEMEAILKQYVDSYEKQHGKIK